VAVARYLSSACAGGCLTAALAFGCSLIAAPVQAHPTAYPSFVVQGEPWPGRGTARITYFNTTQTKWPVKQAAKAWNSSGANVRFVPASRKRAKLVIVDESGPRSDGFLRGTGTLGYIRPGQLSIIFGPDGRPKIRKLRRPNRVTLSRLAHPRRPNYNMAGVVAHEFGHVLGLNHEDGECATMNSVLWMRCSDARPCRLLERDDIQGAIKLYGGRVRTPTPPFCPKPPKKVERLSDPRAYSVTLEWGNPRGGLFTHTTVARGKGKCPTSPGQSGGIPLKGNRPGKVVRLEDDNFAGNSGLRTGRYCYALWGESDSGVRSRRKTVWVNFDPVRPTAPTQLAAVLGQAGEVTLSWTVEPHPELDMVEGSGAIGQCPAKLDPGSEHFVGDADRATVVLTEPGRYCFAAWAVDSVGDAIGPPATVFVDYAGEPPTAEFYFSSESLTTYFENYSYDEDGEIVSYRWEFGDGTTSTESDPTHTYAAAGTYTVSLTVTDDTGQTGTTTQQVTVSDDGEPPPEP
jgi:hypothetical protein